MHQEGLALGLANYVLPVALWMYQIVQNHNFFENLLFLPFMLLPLLLLVLYSTPFFSPGTPFLSLLFNLYKLKILLQVSASWTCLSWRKTRKRYLYSVHYQKLRHAEKHLAQWSTRSLELQAVVGPLAPASIGENTWLVSPGWSVAAKLVNPRILRTVRCYCMQWYAVESKTDHLEGFEGSRHRKPALSWKLLKMLLDNDFHANHFRLYPGHNICIHIHNIEYTNIPMYLLKIVAIDQNQSW